MRSCFRSDVKPDVRGVGEARKKVGQSLECCFLSAGPAWQHGCSTIEKRAGKKSTHVEHDGTIYRQRAG